MISAAGGDRAGQPRGGDAVAKVRRPDAVDASTAADGGGCSTRRETRLSSKPRVARQATMMPASPRAPTFSTETGFVQAPPAPVGCGRGVGRRRADRQGDAKRPGSIETARDDLHRRVAPGGTLRRWRDPAARGQARSRAESTTTGPRPDARNSRQTGRRAVFRTPCGHRRTSVQPLGWLDIVTVARDSGSSNEPRTVDTRERRNRAGLLTRLLRDTPNEGEDHRRAQAPRARARLLSHTLERATASGDRRADQRAGEGRGSTFRALASW